MYKTKKRIVILTEVELRKTLSRLTSQIIEKVKNLDKLLLVGIPTRGIDLAEVLTKELSVKTGLKIRQGIIDPTFIEMIKIELELANKSCRYSNSY